MQHPSHLPKHQRPQPEVADREPDTSCSESDLDLSITPRTGEVADLSNFKVFLKKNLPYQPTPNDLLANIHRRIEQIKTEESA